MSIDILLSTYNSQAYLEELLFSLSAQSYTKWRLLVRDDCSSDSTVSMLLDFQTKNKSKVTLIENKGERLGPKGSFEHLMESSSAAYMMFCDHDDYWLPNKIQDSLDEIQKLEQNNPGKPALVFTDLSVVDETLQIIHASFWKYSKVNPTTIFNTHKLLINNPVAGCTCMVNKAVKKLVLPFPEQARMHDWWIALKIAEAGVANYIQKPTLLYRQHKKNKIGAEHINSSYFKNRISNLSRTINQNIQSYQMMKCLDKNYSLLKLLYYKLHISLSKLV